ncbi:MAG: hypothetical protein PWR30_264 [Candidatus Woesearchaeota archaeon]|nr:hypothetical protein [Candidatus Woesearchaeota archaeon]
MMTNEYKDDLRKELEEWFSKDLYKKINETLKSVSNYIVTFFNPSSDEKPAKGEAIEEIITKAPPLPDSVEYSKEDKSDSTLETLLFEEDIKGYLPKEKDEQILDNLSYWYNLLDSFYKTKLPYFDNFLKKNGMNPRYPQNIANSKNDLGNVVAYTDCYTKIGASLNLKDKVDALSIQYSIPPEDVEELLVTHELMHMSQPSQYLTNKYLAEIHNESLLTKYFMEMADKEEDEKEKYVRLASVTYGRMLSNIGEYIENGAKYLNEKEYEETSKKIDKILEETTKLYDPFIAPYQKESESSYNSVKPF